MEELPHAVLYVSVKSEIKGKKKKKKKVVQIVIKYPSYRDGFYSFVSPLHLTQICIFSLLLFIHFLWC